MDHREELLWVQDLRVRRLGRLRLVVLRAARLEGLEVIDELLELGQLQLARAVCVVSREHLDRLLARRLKAELGERADELRRVDSTGRVAMYSANAARMSASAVSYPVAYAPNESSASRAYA